MRLVLASNNAKKLAELTQLLSPLRVELVPQSALQVAEADEPYGTFIENALTKARHAAQRAGSAAIADDSGLCVDALGGAPGVASAHYAALPPRAAGAALEDREGIRSRQDAANNAELLKHLGQRSDRAARYVATLVAVRSADDPEPLVAVGRWYGTILTHPRGSGGFGYDPLMYIPAFQCSVAELDPAIKQLHSHRAIAAARLLDLMREAWHLG